MDFLNSLGKTIAGGTKVAAEKAKELSELASLKAQIASRKETISKLEKEIGALYVEKFGDCPDEDFQEMVTNIFEARKDINELSLQVDELKNKENV